MYIYKKMPIISKLLTTMKSITLLIVLGCVSASYASVSLTVDGLKATVKNEHVELNFNADSKLSSAKVDGISLQAIGAYSFYLDWNNNGQGYFNPSSIHIVEQAANRVHFYWLQENIENVFRIELHYIMEDGLNGIYSYAKYTNDKTYNLTLGETRTVYKFNANIMSQFTNQHRFGTTPTQAELDQITMVQDSTWQYPNGTYYSKYDFATYLRQINYQGVYGGGFGAFLISPSRDYHGGGPLRQDLTVHQECLITNYFVSSHFGTPEVNAVPGWTHIYGPWLIYFPTGDNNAIISSVENQVTIEQGRWPYAFVKDDEYPRIRGQVSGLVSGQKSATVVLWSSVAESFDNQQLGYLYSAETDSTGYYIMTNVRPGTYRIAAYPTAGLGSDSVAESWVTLAAGAREHVSFTLTEPTNIMWSLGEANRISTEFKYSSEIRNYKWQWLPPVTNTFTIGQSNPAEDWYYAQAQPGHWYIKYQDTQDGAGRTLRIALAAASQKTHLLVYVNGHKVAESYYDNDQSVYRSATTSGSYYSHVFTVNSAQVVSGENTVDLWISLGQIMYDTISLQWG